MPHCLRHLRAGPYARHITLAGRLNGLDTRTFLLGHHHYTLTMGHTALDDENNFDTEFGGIIARRELERKLLWKIDKRMSILVLIYILNYVSVFAWI